MTMSSTTKQPETLAGELVDMGLVPEERRDELAEYLQARLRFLDVFADWEESTERRLMAYLRKLENMHRAATEAAAAFAAHRQVLREQVLPDLKVLLSKDEQALAGIRRAMDGLETLPEPGEALLGERDATGRILEAMNNITERLLKVRATLTGEGEMAAKGRAR